VVIHTSQSGRSGIQDWPLPPVLSSEAELHTHRCACAALASLALIVAAIVVPARSRSIHGRPLRHPSGIVGTFYCTGSREMAAAVRLSLPVHCAERQPGHRGCRSLRTACSALRLRKREAGPSGSSSAEDPPSAAWCPPGKAAWEFTVTVVEGLVVSVATSTLSGCIVSRNSARLDGVVREAALEPAERAPGLRSRAPRELGAARAGEDARADVVDERSLDAH
jgi:hypothetical protein